MKHLIHGTEISCSDVQLIQYKTEDDYGRFFLQWYETDLRNFIRRDRNHLSVIMWSVGNEIPNQFYPDESLLLKKS